MEEAACRVQDRLNASRSDLFQPFTDTGGDLFPVWLAHDVVGMPWVFLIFRRIFASNRLGHIRGCEIVV